MSGSGGKSRKEKMDDTALEESHFAPSKPKDIQSC